MQDLRRRFRRRFAVISTAVTVTVAIGVAVLIANTYWNLLMGIGERRHGEVAREFYAAAHEQSGEFLATARTLAPEAIRGHPETQRLTALAKSFVRGSRVVRVAIHDENGRTLFSSAADQIGALPANRRDLETARAGQTTATRMTLASFRAVDGRAADRKLIESFVPVRGPDGKPAIVSLYSDATGYHIIVEESLVILIAVVVGALFAVLGMLIFYVGRDRVLQEQQQKNVALTESVRLAEEASRLKSRFVASMGHELRTPLNAIIGFSEAVKSKVFGPLGSAKYDDYATTIHGSGKHLLAVVDDILDMARIEGGKAVLHETVFSLRAALSNCAQLIAPEAERHGQLFAARMPDGLPALRGDEAKIKQIVLNLLANAVRYTPRGGRVGLSAEQRADGSIVIAVTDNGIGIPATELQSVFEPFRQVDNEKVRQSGGLGLGLNIAKSFAELHEAALWLESEPGRGTVACLALPGARLVHAGDLSAAA
jgi:signal transduction histidine kinase